MGPGREKGFRIESNWTLEYLKVSYQRFNTDVIVSEAGWEGQRSNVLLL